MTAPALAPIVIHARVDALVIAFRVAVREDIRRELARASETAKVHSRAEVRVADLSWELKNGAATSVHTLRREEHVRLRVDLNASGGEIVPDVSPLGEPIMTQEPGWTLEVVFYASHLAEHGDRSALREARELARRFGIVYEGRLRRIDLAADVMRWRICESDRRAMVQRSRVKRARHRVVTTSLRETEASCVAYDTSRKLTGIVVGKGDVVARMYDKREELAVCSPHKLAAEEARWLAGGWDGRSRVSRVEFQIRGEALKELGCRALDSVHDPETGEVFDLHDYLPRVWASCLRWVRLVKRTRTRTGALTPLTRCAEDARWLALRKTQWGYAQPIKRKRERGGATSAQALGSVLSVAASRGRLSGRLSEEHRMYQGATVTELQAMLSVVAKWGVDLIASDLIERWKSPDAACVHVAVLWNAARARFARILEEERNHPPWPKSNRESTQPALSLAQNNTASPSPDLPKSPSTS